VKENGAIVDPETGGSAGVGSPCVEAGVHYGYDAGARAGAEAELTRFLAGIFKDS
jgi:hypothetical protein